MLREPIGELQAVYIYDTICVFIRTLWQTVWKMDCVRESFYWETSGVEMAMFHLIFQSCDQTSMQYKQQIKKTEYACLDFKLVPCKSVRLYSLCCLSSKLTGTLSG